MRSACLALKHSKHQLSPTKSYTICPCHEAAQIKHRLNQQKACRLGKTAKGAQDLPRWIKPRSACLDFCFQRGQGNHLYSSPIPLRAQQPNAALNCRNESDAVSPTAMNKTRFRDVTVTAVLAGELTRQETSIANSGP